MGKDPSARNGEKMFLLLDRAVPTQELGDGRPLFLQRHSERGRAVFAAGIYVHAAAEQELYDAR